MESIVPPKEKWLCPRCGSSGLQSSDKEGFVTCSLVGCSTTFHWCPKTLQTECDHSPQDCAKYNSKVEKYTHELIVTRHNEMILTRRFSNFGEAMDSLGLLARIHNKNLNASLNWASFVKSFKPMKSADDTVVWANSFTCPEFLMISVVPRKMISSISESCPLCGGPEENLVEMKNGSVKCTRGLCSGVCFHYCSRTEAYEMDHDPTECSRFIEHTQRRALAQSFRSAWKDLAFSTSLRVNLQETKNWWMSDYYLRNPDLHEDAINVAMKMMTPDDSSPRPVKRSRRRI